MNQNLSEESLTGLAAEWSTAVIRDQVRDHDVATLVGSLWHKGAGVATS